MNKALHVFVYLFLIIVGLCCWYEKRAYDRHVKVIELNSAYENFFMRDISGLIETGSDYSDYKKGEGDEDSGDAKNPEIRMDVDLATDHNKVEPKMDDVLQTLKELKVYDVRLETLEHETISLNTNDLNALRNIIDDSMEGEAFGAGYGPQIAKLDSIKRSLESQKAQLEMARKAIPALRNVIKEVVEQYNEVVPQLRENIRTNIDRQAQIEKLTKDKAEIISQKAELESQLKEKELDLVSARDALELAKSETSVVTENLEKQTQLVETLKKQIQQLIAAQQQLIAGRGTITEGGAIQSLPFGDKGKVISANKEYMFAIIELTPEAMKQLKGDDLSHPLPVLELGVKRPGFNGPAGEFIGRVRLRQEVVGKNYVTCEILSNWSQDDLKQGDIVFAE